MTLYDLPCDSRQSVATLANHYAGVYKEVEDEPRIRAAHAIGAARGAVMCAQDVR